jgi:hypothetical protein
VRIGEAVRGAIISFAAYDSSGVRLLSGVLADAMISARKTIGHQLSEAEGLQVKAALTKLAKRDVLAASGNPIQWVVKSGGG